MDDWEASVLNASRQFHLVRSARIRELEDEVKRLQKRIKDLEENV
jgi:polyhydroxyalkanoate synthesis regulator phasin